MKITRNSYQEKLTIKDRIFSPYQALINTLLTKNNEQISKSVTNK